MSDVLRQLLNQPAWAVYAVVALVVFAEDALFFGFIIPGETAAILGGVSASIGHTSLGWMLLLVCAAAIVGDSVGYEVGRTLGPRLLSHRHVVRHEDRVGRASDILRRRGGVAILLGRWTAFLRALMPALAGASGMHYGKFLRWNAIGGIAWGITVVMAGQVAGMSYQRVAHWLGTGTAVAVAAIVVIGLVVWQVRRRAAEKAAGGPPATA